MVGVEGLLVLDEAGGEVALGYLLLAAKNGNADSEVGGALEEPVLRVDGDVARTAEGLDGELALRAGDVDAAGLLLTRRRRAGMCAKRSLSGVKRT